MGKSHKNLFFAYPGCFQYQHTDIGHTYLGIQNLKLNLLVNLIPVSRSYQ